MAKARDAFRTISEVSETLDTPAHVLRFWESKFSQVKPVKRAGGRRYYRPDDVALLGGIKTLLHDEGMTIKAVQKMLRSEGVKHVASLGADTVAPSDGDVIEHKSAVSAPVSKSVQPDNVVPLQARPRTPEPAPEPAPSSEPLDDVAASADQTDLDVSAGLPPAPKPSGPASATAAEVEPTISMAMPPPTPLASVTPDDTFETTDAPEFSLAEDATDDEEGELPVTPPAPGFSDADLPPLLSDDPVSPGPRIFDALAQANPAALRQDAARIAPLLARLEELHERMRRLV